MTKPNDPIERITAALADLGAQGEPPPPGWEQRVQAAVGIQSASSGNADPLVVMSDDYRTRVREVLTRRLDRLFRLLALQAPDCILATEVDLIGKVAVMIDPYGMARREAERNERRTRERIGLCAHIGCSSEPARDSLEWDDTHCDEHARALRVDIANSEELAQAAAATSGLEPES